VIALAAVRLAIADVASYTERASIEASVPGSAERASGSCCR
jgi:hypothetical protein